MMASDDLAKYQVKSITPVDQYVCSLSEETKKRAFEEMGETEELRQKSIKEIREWVLNNPRIEKARLDSRAILRYLRHHNYDMDCVRESFERVLIFRATKEPKEAAGYDWIENLDFEKPHMQDLLDAGVMMVLEDYSENGERVIYTKLSAANTKFPNVAYTGMCLATQFFEILLDDEENQVRGFHYIFDVSGITLRHYFLLSFTTWFKMLKNCERTYSGRHRGCHVINMPSALLFVVKLAFSHMNQKMKDGIKFYSSLDELKFINKDKLPDLIGGKVPSKSITDPWKKKLTDWRSFLMNYKNQKINKEFYSPAVLNCEVKTLAHRLENPKAKLLTKY